jgi:signal transduction histidine kinase
VTGAALALTAVGLMAGVVILWVAAIASLIDGPTGNWYLPPTYVIAAVFGPVPLLWLSRQFGDEQRSRFRRLLRVDIPRPPRPAGRWTPWRPWLSSATWRQFGYHLVACVLLPVGVLGLPFGAGGLFVRADTALARRLLGPSVAEQLAVRVEALSRSRADLIAAADAERRRIERDLHDGAQQRLVHLAMNLGMARESLRDIPEPARLVIEQAHDEATAALTSLREFVRGLHPAVMNDRGLDAALSGIVATSPVPVRLTVRVEPRCSASIEAIAYFTVSEALTNIAKHASARRASVALDRVGERLRIVVTDDGGGGATLSRGSGLQGLLQRAAAVDGTMTVHSPSGGPTVITVELPCE